MKNGNNNGNNNGANIAKKCSHGKCFFNGINIGIDCDIAIDFSNWSTIMSRSVRVSASSSSPDNLMVEAAVAAISNSSSAPVFSEAAAAAVVVMTTTQIHWI